MGLVLLVLGVIVAQNGTSQLKGGPGGDAMGTKSKMEGGGLDKTEQSEGTRSQGGSRADAETSVSGSESSQQSRSTSSRSGSALTIRSRTSGGTPIKKKKSFPWQPIVFTLLMVILAALVARGTWAGLSYVERKKEANKQVAKVDDKPDDDGKKKTVGSGDKPPQGKLRATEGATEGAGVGVGASSQDTPLTKPEDPANVPREKGNCVMEWLRERCLPVSMGGYEVGKGGKKIPGAAKIAAGAVVGTGAVLGGMKASGSSFLGWGWGPSAPATNTSTPINDGGAAGNATGKQPDMLEGEEAIMMGPEPEPKV